MVAITAYIHDKNDELSEEVRIKIKKERSTTPQLRLSNRQVSSASNSLNFKRSSEDMSPK